MTETTAPDAHLRLPAEVGAAVAGATENAGRILALAPYLRVLAIWLASRCVVAVGVVLGKVHVPLGDGAWLGGPRWYHRLLRWDSEWYHIIATEGYRYNGNPLETQTVVFYPLYPALSRMVATVTGLATADAMLLVANLCSLAAVLLLFRLFRTDLGERTALSAVALLAFFPTSVFLSAGYTEPLALLLMASFFLALRSERFLAAACLAGLACATRSSGIVLAPVLLWSLWRTRGARDIRLLLPVCAILSVSGLLLYVGYLGYAFGHPMAFSDGQMAFHENVPMARRVVSALLLGPVLRIDPTDLSPAGLDQWFFLLFAGLIAARLWLRLDFAMTLFAGGVLLLPYLTLSGGPAGLISMARFNVVSFPLFATMALLLSRHAPWAIPTATAVFGGLLMLYAALFSQWQWIG